MHRKHFFIVVLAVVILLLSCNLFLRKTTLTVITPENVEGSPYANVYQELQKQATPPSPSKGSCSFGSLWIIQKDPLLGKTRETAILPCAWSMPNDVGTAGSSDWKFAFEVLSQGDLDIRVHDVSVSLTADPNTDMEFNGNTHSPEVRQDGGTYRASTRAATVDSSKEPGKDCSVYISWSAVVRINHGNTGCTVTLDSSAPYRNNC